MRRIENKLDATATMNCTTHSIASKNSEKFKFLMQLLKIAPIN